METLDCASFEEAPKCGVKSKFLAPNITLSVAGSFSLTSIAAPAMTPLFIASFKSTSLI